VAVVVLRFVVVVHEIVPRCAVGGPPQVGLKVGMIQSHAGVKNGHHLPRGHGPADVPSFRGADVSSRSSTGRARILQSPLVAEIGVVRNCGGNPADVVRRGGFHFRHVLKSRQKLFRGFSRAADEGHLPSRSSGQGV
jgi:hypothetical protein